MQDFTTILWSKRYRDRTALGRFVSKIKILPSGCWIWQGAISSTGYGVVRVNQRTMLAHRTMFLLWYGHTENELDHICRERSCVNPEHLEPVTHWENNARGVSPSAKSLRAKHCKHGHPWSVENTGAGINGTRRCLACHRTSESNRRNK